MWLVHIDYVRLFYNNGVFKNSDASLIQKLGIKIPFWNKNWKVNNNHLINISINLMKKTKRSKSYL